MVQFKASSLVLVALLAGYAQTSVLARKNNVRDYREDGLSTRDVQDKIIRAVIEEALLTRSTDSGSSELWTRDFEAVEQRSPEPATNFFMEIGRFVKRVFHEYWREMKDDVALLDLRRYHKHEDFRSRRHRLEGDHLDLRDGDSDNFRSRRRRFSGGQLARRSDHDDFRERRRRFSAGHLARRSHQDDYRDRRRRFSNGKLVRRHHQDDYRDRRRRFSNGHIARGSTSDLELLIPRDEQPELLPRMSWYGKALLIYRDMKHSQASEFARSTRESDDALRARQLTPYLHIASRSLDELD